MKTNNTDDQPEDKARSEEREAQLTADSADLVRSLGRLNAGGYYDLQEVRLSTMNRLRDLIRKRLDGISFDQPEAKQDKETKTYDKEWTDAQLLTKLTTILETGAHDFNESEVKYVKRMVDILTESEKLESKYQRSLKDYIEHEPVWTEWLGATTTDAEGKETGVVRGISFVLTANLLKHYGYCESYETVSQLWAHSGLAVRDGVADRRRKGEKTRYDPDKKVLAWKIADCLLKARGQPYRSVYDSEKEKQLAREYEPGALLSQFGAPYKPEDTKLSKGHAHARALRKMSKLFLSHYWEVTRRIKGLDIRALYVEEKLGHKNIIRPAYG